MIEIILIFILGLIVGSFLNCVIYRISKEESFIKGRSYCPKCRHDLDFFDLVPVLSFVFLSGRCRYCKEPISWQYPLVELATGFLFSFVYFQFGPVTSLFSYVSLEMLFWLIIWSLFVIMFIFDWKHYIIPDEVIYPAIILSLLWAAYSFFAGFIGGEQILQMALSALGASLFFFLIWFFSKGKAMGFGDVKLAFLMGILLGWPKIVLGLFLGFLFGAIIGIILIVLRKKGMRSEIPFGPFLIIGTFLALFFGQAIINWYMSLIL